MNTCIYKSKFRSARSSKGSRADPKPKRKQQAASSPY